MINLDMRTVVLLAAISYLICTVFVVQLWRQSRGRFDGMNFLAINFVLQTVALGLIVSRGAIPDWISIFLANILVLAGALLSYIGLERFLHKPGVQLHNYLLFVVGSFALGILSVVHPDLPKRTLVTAVVLLLICGQCVWLLWRRVEPALRPLAFGTSLVFAGYCLVSIVRIVGYFAGATGPGDYFQSGTFNALVIISYHTLLILLTYSLVLMVNRRLIMEITTEQDKFASAFRSAPYAITLTRLSDGMIVDVNDQFVAITGYDRAEVVGKSTIGLHIWERDEDRAAVAEILARDGRVQAREVNFRTKLGEPVVELLSADVILADGERHVLSCILDISGRKQVDAALRESEARYHSLFDNSHVVMLLIDPEGGAIVAANPAAATFYGWTQEQLQAMRIDQINVLSPAEVAAEMQRAQAQQHNGFEFRHRLADGQVRDVEVFSGPVQVGGRSLLYSIVHDVSSRKQADRQLAESEARREAETNAALEARQQGQLAALNLMEDAIAARATAEEALVALARLSRLYATLSQSTHVIVHCDSEDALFPQICRDAVNFGGLKMAWIGLVDESGHKVMPVASFGAAADYLSSAQISMDAGNPRGQGPTATAIRENQPVWCQDFLHDPRTAPWHEGGAREGWKASVSLPLQRAGVTVGALTLYAGEANFFDDAIQKLLIDMAADISFAMDSYASMAERKRAELKMAEQLDELRRWQGVMLGREGRIMEMKKEVNNLLAGQGQPPRYPSAADEEQKE